MSSRPPSDHEAERRYTEQEVGLVLQRAAEIEERGSEAVAPHGVTLRELREIAREVGIRPEVIDEAVALVQAGAGPRGRSLLGAPLSSKSVRGVPGRLGQEAMQRLVRVIEDHVEATGTVTEALGQVRWTSVGRGHKFDRTTQVSLSVRSDETQIQVVQRYPSGLRTVLHLLPGAWGGMIGGAVAASAGVTALAGIGIGVGAVALGIGIGHGVWQMLAGRNAREAQRVASEVARAARDLVGE